MKPYSKPDINEWPEGDPRRRMAGFDEDFLRGQYDERMPGEQPAIHHWTPSKVLQRVCDAVVLRDGAVLDVGCGNGRVLAWLLKHNHIDSGMGIDISDYMVENAIQTAIYNRVEIPYLRTSIEEFVPPHRFDTIIATEILEHIYLLRGALGRMTSWLVNDGMFAGAVPLEHVCDAVVHLHYFTQDSLRELLSDFFDAVNVEIVDETSEGEYHLVFICRQPRKGSDE